MIITLELSADEARVLQEIAQAAGTTVEMVLHGLIAQVSPSAPAPPPSPLPVDLEALAEQKREQEEIEANVRRWHAEQAQA